MLLVCPYLPEATMITEGPHPGLRALGIRLER